MTLDLLFVIVQVRKGKSHFNKINRKMLKESKRDEAYEKMVSQIIERVKKQGYSDIRADINEYESPHKLIGQSKKISYTPDITGKKDDGLGYFEIAKKVQNTNELVNKWKALSLLADMKNGVFKVYVPHGHMKFTRELINDHNIKAEIVKL